MRVEFIQNKAVIHECVDFEPAPTFECGQCFRFNRIENVYEGVALNSFLRVEKQDGAVTLFPCSKEEYESKWKGYFDLEREYGCLFNNADEPLRAGLQCAAGLRILNQPPFETMISFIVSANNNVKRISGIVDKLCHKYGKPFVCEGRTYYAFPEPWALAGASEAEIKELGAGYRAPYIIGAAKMVHDGFDLDALREMLYFDAKKKLMSLPGVGPKVADCVLLFSLGHSRAFPADVWIKRVLKDDYGFIGNDRQTAEFAIKTFGEHAGIAQQYLFFWKRESKK